MISKFDISIYIMKTDAQKAFLNYLHKCNENLDQLDKRIDTDGLLLKQALCNPDIIIREMKLKNVHR